MTPYIPHFLTRVSRKPALLAHASRRLAPAFFHQGRALDEDGRKPWLVGWQRLTNPLMLIALICFVGCGDNTGIRVYRIAKSDAQPRTVSSAAATAAEDAKLLATLIPHGKAYWVFKLQDSPEVVGRNEGDFRKIVKSLKFKSNGEPSWDLLEGWSSKRSLGGFTYAEITKESDDIRATVSELPILPDTTWQKLVVSNVDRWRDQLSLDKKGSWEGIASHLEEVDLGEGDSKAYFVSIEGRTSGGGGMGPFQRMMQQPPPSAPASAQPDSSEATAAANSEAEAQLHFDAPEAWQEVDASSSQMRRAAFKIDDNGKQAEVTVVTAGGSINANMGMWFAQAKLESSEDAIQQVLNAAQESQVNQVPVTTYFIDGSQGEAHESILVAEIAWRPAESLFVKLKGDSELVESQRENFEKFLESLRWK